MNPEAIKKLREVVDTGQTFTVNGRRTQIYRGIGEDGEPVELFVAAVADVGVFPPDPPPALKETGIDLVERVLREQVIPATKAETLVLFVQSRCGCIGSVVAAPDLGAKQSISRQFVDIGNSGGKATLRIRVEDRRLLIEPVLDVSRPAVVN